MSISLFSVRLSRDSYLQYGGLNDHFLLLSFGFIGNLVWISSIVWFILSGNWLILIPVFLINFIVFNLFVVTNLILIKLKYLVSLASIICLFGMWHTYIIETHSLICLFLSD